ncbi:MULTISPECIES: LysR family transcriptional regulator [unclassified Paenibacillus]|jgi:LysR family transcriptional regulator, cyn operon transcriptional activator|uniref:LysR family transcriptional regulator n=1 Tax=unclassified Paenibacillus TaxID=185978 RepID=UPI00096F0FBF|nr:LysR family transcriptional regulator [Paenibacillus sp. FSL H8-0259]OMF27835.1 LysR family transcriptional regulator [Paenibacillus sp. FSL H8-0259]
MSINLEWYRVFYWIARTGSLSRAAEHLHITQPAVSHTIKQLENSLGGQLFFRTAKGVILTKEGEVLFHYLEQAFNFVDIGEKALAEMNNLNSGEIAIGASDTLCKYFLLPYLEQFHALHPRIRIRVTNRTTPETITLLKEGKIDFGIVSLPASDKQVEFYESQPIQDSLVGGKDFQNLAAEGPLAIEALHHYPLLILEPGSSTRRYLDHYAASCGVKLEPEFELGSVDLLVQFASSGFGLAFVVRNYITEELKSGKLFEIPLKPPVPERRIGIATLRGVPLSSATRAFLELLPRMT